jgi:16S rRNA (adenine1518-N6/adenine1519-N6)-dimethyltransferase
MATSGKRRAYGQHFLRDSNAIEQIVSTTFEKLAQYECKGLLEIGPGRGALTGPILERLEALIPLKNRTLESFVICERDPVLISDWRIRFTDTRATPSPIRNHLAEGDFLEVEDTEWLKATPLGVVSNLPYSVGTAIFTRLAAQARAIPFMTLMFQAEVAARLRAEPETKPWGSLSVWTQNQWEVSKLLSVPPRSFSPPPAVDSEVVLVTRRTTPLIPQAVSHPEAWDHVLKACFAHRRKMLRSGLSGDHPMRNALDVSGVDGTKRAEALQWGEWERLLEAYVSPKSSS